MKCAYCGNEIIGTGRVEWEGLSFCNAIHRYSYKSAQQSFSAPAVTLPNSSSSRIVGTNLWIIAGSVVGFALGLYTGIHVIVPFVLMIGVLWVLNRTNTVPLEARSIIAILTAQFGWLALGGVITGAWDQLYVDLLFVGGGTIWLLIRMHAIPVIILLLFQFGLLLINTDLLLQSESGSEGHKALIVHIVLRIMLLFALSKGLYSLRWKAVREQ